VSLIDIVRRIRCRRDGIEERARLFPVLGVVFVIAASAELILLSFNPHGAEHLKDLLVGKILWVEPRELLPVTALYAGVVAAFLIFDLRRQRALFYLVFAVTITASVQFVGLYLVFASLILPALAAAGARAATSACLRLRRRPGRVHLGPRRLRALGCADWCRHCLRACGHSRPDRRAAYDAVYGACATSPLAFAAGDNVISVFDSRPLPNLANGA
jgi:hypothetical protein